jgi:hypothetical protein
VLDTDALAAPEETAAAGDASGEGSDPPHAVRPDTSTSAAVRLTNRGATPER